MVFRPLSWKRRGTAEVDVIKEMGVEIELV